MFVSYETRRSPKLTLLYRFVDLCTLQMSDDCDSDAETEEEVPPPPQSPSLRRSPGMYNLATSSDPYPAELPQWPPLEPSAQPQQ